MSAGQSFHWAQSNLLSPTGDLGVNREIQLLQPAYSASLSKEPTPVSTARETIKVPTDFPTIQDAVDAACPGDTIEVESGSYRENVDVYKRLTLQGIDTGMGMPLIDAGHWVSGITLNQDCVTVAGFIITNSSLGAGVEIQSDYNIIFNNTITGNSLKGLKFKGERSGNIISENRISRNGFSGLAFDGEAIDNTILDNDISKNGFGGVSFTEVALGNLIMGNNISENGFVGIQFKDRSMDNYIVRNLVVGNKFGGIDLLGNASCNQITGNLLVRNNFTGLSLSQNTSCNLAFDNYLLDNLEHSASDGGSGNRWDNGTIGNYYSDFECEDKDGNGICDNACGIYGGSGLDRYPLAYIIPGLV